MLSLLSQWWAAARYWIGRMWGKTTTTLLAVLVMVHPLIQSLDPAIFKTFPQLQTAMILMGLAIGILRLVAPPPPAVVIERSDSVILDKDVNAVIIAKGGPVKDSREQPKVAVVEGGASAPASVKEVSKTVPTA